MHGNVKRMSHKPVYLIEVKIRHGSLVDLVSDEKIR